MIRLIRPDERLVERYRLERAAMEPSFERPVGSLTGFHVSHDVADLGTDSATFEHARSALVQWQAHIGAGVEPNPADIDLAVGNTVALVTRQLGLWILAACRIISIVDTDASFGFTYATLPDHPECGEERFTVTSKEGCSVQFEVAATWRPDTLVARLGSPVARIVQRRATQSYLDAMVQACAEPTSDTK